VTYKVRPDVNGLSKLATFKIDKLKDVNDRTQPVWGIVVHTTGSGIVKQARKHGAAPFEYAVAYYLKPESYFAHYVVGYDGQIAQIADEHERATHVGVTTEDREAYLSGAWRKMLPPHLVELWERCWPGHKSPAHLYPGKSVNDCTVGIEVLPVDPPATIRPLRYTRAQHFAVSELCADIAARWGLPSGWHLTSRLTGHEDVAPLARCTKKPPAGWDPGALRDTPWWSWPLVKQDIARIG